GIGFPFFESRNIAEIRPIGTIFSRQNGCWRRIRGNQPIVFWRFLTYIATQRTRYARSVSAGLPFWTHDASLHPSFERDSEKIGPGFSGRDRASALSGQKSSHEPPQRRHHRPRRPRQDHAGRSPAA